MEFLLSFLYLGEFSELGKFNQIENAGKYQVLKEKKKWNLEKWKMEG